MVVRVSCLMSAGWMTNAVSLILSMETGTSRTSVGAKLLNGPNLTATLALHHGLRGIATDLHGAHGNR